MISARFYNDILRALEDGAFAVETPTHYVEQDNFLDIAVCIERGTPQTVGNFTPWEFEISFDYFIDKHPHSLEEDIDSGELVVMYGNSSLWYVEDLLEKDLTYDVRQGEKVIGTMEARWRNTQMAEWR